MLPKIEPEPWLRGTLIGVPAVLRAVLHALELAKEDLHRWCSELTEQQLHDRHANLPSVAFQIRHIARSIDRLLTYAEGKSLSEQQLARLRSESDASVSREAIFQELDTTLDSSAARILAFVSADLEQPRTVGKELLPATLGGLLVHVADHTQRHVGQAITTAKIVVSAMGSR